MITVNVFKVTGLQGFGFMFMCGFTGSALSMLSDVQGGLGALQHKINTIPPSQSIGCKFYS